MFIYKYKAIKVWLNKKRRINMKSKIMVTLDKDTLQNFDKMLEARMIPRSRFFERAMKNELEHWTMIGDKNGL